ncbi:MAG: sn-glycerol-1-phosphate dehydrogenase [Ruminococcaceae bacterium]|nr:sn-glycerol-1-phosphate dehydrogenase [Oscillospiraceae bacterium]
MVFMNNTIYDYIQSKSFCCQCGKIHGSALQELIIEAGALKKLPGLIKKYGGHKVFVLSDVNTHSAAGETVCALLQDAGIPYSGYVFPQAHLEPDEFAVGGAVMHFDSSCDLILGVGSGVINDIGKILANLTGKLYMIVATAPSMDGYASATSSMARSGLKVSLNSCCPSVIIGDLEVLCAAPEQMLQSGLGDMVAKYVSICEWRIANLLIGEEYCPTIAQMVREALHKCVTNSEALVRREPDAVAAVMEGLVITGIAMSYAGISRPASGMEHYFSHIWDMRGLAFGTAVDTHGIQCGIGTLMGIRTYEQICKLTPNKEKALAYVTAFDAEAWNETLLEFLGSGAEAMIQNECKEGKYDKNKHAHRLEIILKNWDNVLKIIEEEIPAYELVAQALKAVGAPTLPEQLGISQEEIRGAFLTAKDIRDKYVGTRLLWDLGCLEEVADTLFPL